MMLPMTRKARKTPDIKPISDGHQVKPGELIDVHLPANLTLNDRKRFNALLWHAWDRIDEHDAEHTIHLDELRYSHDSTDRIDESVKRLMGAVVEVRTTGRKGQPVTRRAQLLGGNDMDDDERYGVLTYTFDKRLVSIIKNSTIWGQLRKEIMAAFSSKYALALYELIEKRINMKYRYSEDWSLDELRGRLGVAKGKMTRWSNLNQRVVKPALDEVNALADFNVRIQPLKRGRATTGVRVEWWIKSNAEREEAQRELEQPRVGRKARVQGTAEQIAEEQDAEDARIRENLEQTPMPLPPSVDDDEVPW